MVCIEQFVLICSASYYLKWWRREASFSRTVEGPVLNEKYLGSLMPDANYGF